MRTQTNIHFTIRTALRALVKQDLGFSGAIAFVLFQLSREDNVFSSELVKMSREQSSLYDAFEILISEYVKVRLMHDPADEPIPLYNSFSAALLAIFTADERLHESNRRLVALILACVSSSSEMLRYTLESTASTHSDVSGYIDRAWSSMLEFSVPKTLIS